MGEALLSAYTAYLERVFLDSDELTPVDGDTVPDSVNLPVVQEWADLVWPTRTLTGALFVCVVLSHI